MSPDNRIGVGIIGDRGHALRMRRVVELSDKATLTYIFHPKREPDHPLGGTTLENLKECDAVIIAAPNIYHFEYLNKIFWMGKVYFFEKPIASKGLIS